MDTGRFVSEIHRSSGLGAVLEEDGDTAYLYMTLGSGKIISHVFVYPGRSDKPLTFRWSEDGRSVALLVSERPIAFILDGEAVGYCRSVVEGGPVGSTWDEAKYDSAFRGI